MPGKAKIAAPIDRPLSRAYLRQFTGWSTAYPPGVSDPTSLRLMENMRINRNGTCRIRPGLRFLSYLDLPTSTAAGVAAWPDTIQVGTHETFFLNDGSKAYLYAVRETDLSVGFRVFSDSQKTLDEIGFEVEGVDAINFSSDTTYVKYLQIDNKIFALSDAGEDLRLFFVGAEKRVKRLKSIERPDWSIDDKLEVVEPEAAWINSGIPLDTRINRYKNPTFQQSTDGWEEANKYTRITASDDFSYLTGLRSMKVTSLPERTNLIRSPLYNLAGPGLGDDVDDDGVPVGWSPSGSNIFGVTINSGWMRVRLTASTDRGDYGFAMSSFTDVNPEEKYKVAFDVNTVQGIEDIAVVVRYFTGGREQIGDDEVVNRHMATTAGRRTSDAFKTPEGCQLIRVQIRGYRGPADIAPLYEIRNVLCAQADEPTGMFYGDSAANYYWTGTENDSSSVYHPPKDLHVRNQIDIGAGTYSASVYARAGTTIDYVYLDLYAGDKDGDETLLAGSATADITGGWQRVENEGAVAATGTTYIKTLIRITSVARGDAHYIDAALFERSATVEDYFDGNTSDTPELHHRWGGDEHNSISIEDEFSVGSTTPTSETKTADTLISSTHDDNIYSFGFFYTFSNEIGESAVSQVTVVHTQRAWSQWYWETPDSAGEPSGTPTQDPGACCDQLAAYMPSDVFADAKAAGATSWSLYMFTWSNQDPMPISGQKVDSREINEDLAWAGAWLRVTPSQAESSAESALVPNKNTRFNSSAPSHAGQGLVAADRMVLVYDPTAQAVIKWTSNLQGSYSNFSPAKGGGYKTLTSGNLFIPACVKLWQNPQSADTLTILCMGIDGYSTGYYMAPAQISSQSEAITIMAFEETTATPGTTSPFGCEVLNNSLYHPIDEMLMKSTASNYNINHTSMTDMIRDDWQALTSKHQIVSSQLDNRIYLLVNNPSGATLEADCWGNEVWVFDAQAKAGNWSRWTTQGQSLRKIEQGGKVVMSLIHPSGIFYFDDDAGMDHYVSDDGTVLERSIPWLMETNTQGANRAHDAWARLQQANLRVGNFQGAMEYGIRGIDLHGKPITVRKVYRDTDPPSLFDYDREDFMLIQRDMKEWFFFANSIVDDTGETEASFGELSLVQYRYTPSTVNTGYEFGSVETFEYGRAGNVDSTTINGVPVPYIDTGRP